MTEARTQRDTARSTSRSTPRSCPICKGEVSAKATTFPFCSKRCQLVDLGQWFNGSYAISRELKEDDELE